MNEKKHLPNTKRIARRDFLAAAAVTAAGFSTAKTFAAADTPSSNAGKFKLKYAPHFNMFKNLAGNGLADQLNFIADQGFTAFEDNPMMIRPLAEQKKITETMERLDLAMGTFVAYGLWTAHEFDETRFVHNKPEDRQFLKERMEKTVEVAKRTNAKWFTVVPGSYDPGLEWGYQTANVIDNLKYCAEICEKANKVMILEPLNPWKNHPGLFLTKIPQAWQICKAVDSPACKILDDLYHQQVTEGNLIPNLDKAWEQIAYIQIGDNPGRNEPTTGEINYKNIFKHLDDKDFDGIIGMEHGNSKEGKAGERAVIQAYRQCDPA